MATQKVKNVRKERGPKNLSSLTVASTDIWKIQPIFCRETIPNDVWNISHRQLNICDALQVPSFVNVRTRNTMFYVPYSKLWQPFESLMGETSLTINAETKKYQKTPALSVGLLLYVFIEKGYVRSVNTEGVPYDFRILNIDTGVYTKFVFTSAGRRIWSILQGLGYKLSMFLECTGGYDVDDYLPSLGEFTAPLLWDFLGDYTPTIFVDRSMLSIDTPLGTQRLYVRCAPDPYSLVPDNGECALPLLQDGKIVQFRYGNSINPSFGSTYSATRSGVNLIDWSHNDTPISNRTFSDFPDSPSALPLFAYAKAYAENFVPSKYGDKYNKLVSSIYNFTEYCDISRIEYDTNGHGTIIGISSDGLDLFYDIFDMLCTVYYGDDYFTSSPAKAMTTPDNVGQGVEVVDITLDGSSIEDGTVVTVQSPTNGQTPKHQGKDHVGEVSDTPFNVTDYIHNMLHLLTKNIQLKALSGSKLAQRLYSLYGMKSQTYNFEAVVLNQNVSNIDVKSVTSVADTQGLTPDKGTALGQKGGQMNNFNDGRMHFEFNEFGCLFLVNQIIPSYFYGQGLHREMMHRRRNDFYNDQFALAGYQNIARFELFNDDQLGYYKKNSLLPNGSYGLTSAYAEYANRKDTLIGDFSLLSRMLPLDCYHFNRFLFDQQLDMAEDKEIDELGNMPINDENFMKVVARRDVESVGNVTEHQYDRIFTDTDSDDDHIAQFNEFDITAIRDGRSINDFTIGESDGHEVEMAGLGKVIYG